MRDIASKINDSAPASTGYHDAGEFNSTQTELENAVIAAPGGLTLDAAVGPDTSSEMLAQSITRHAAGGAIFCTATGDATSHVLSMADENVRSPSVLFKGLTCRYDPPANNDGNPIQINAFGLGSKPLVNHVSATPASGAIDGRVISIFYDPAIGSGSWVLPAHENALYVGQVPVGEPNVTSGEGWSVDGGNQGNLNFPGLANEATPQAADIFAFHDDSAGAHKSISYAQLLAVLGGGGGIKKMRLITASGTYTKTAGTTKALVFCTGGGGGGGSSNSGREGAGGGAGGTAINLVDLTGIDAVDCLIGAGGSAGVSGSGSAGGSSSFGNFLEASGGGGGEYPLAEGTGHGGLAGVGTVGLLKIAGCPGDSTQTGSKSGGNGGGSFWGGGGRGGRMTINGGQGPTQGQTGASYGAGGGGGDSPGTSGKTPGGAGANGAIVILEFA